MENTEIQIGTRAALVSVVTRSSDEQAAMASLAELSRLLETAGGEAAFVLIQNKESPDVRTYLGSGKVAELALLCRQNDVNLAVFDCELSPSQIRNLEEALGDIDVIDRSMLILDIFALHAVSGEGKLHQDAEIYPSKPCRIQNISRDLKALLTLRQHLSRRNIAVLWVNLCNSQITYHLRQVLLPFDSFFLQKALHYPLYAPP